MHRYVKLVTLGEPISQEEMESIYGRKDANGIPTDSIDIPEEELLADNDALSDLVIPGEVRPQEVEPSPDDEGYLEEDTASLASLFDNNDEESEY